LFREDVEGLQFKRMRHRRASSNLARRCGIARWESGESTEDRHLGTSPKEWIKGPDRPHGEKSYHMVNLLTVRNTAPRGRGRSWNGRGNRRG
jgi:hypothetical protein